MNRLLIGVMLLLAASVSTVRADEVDDTVSAVRAVQTWSDSVRSGDFTSALESTRSDEYPKPGIRARASLAYLRFVMHCGDFRKRGYDPKEASDHFLAWFADNLDVTEASFLKVAKEKPAELVLVNRWSEEWVLQFEKLGDGKKSHDGSIDMVLSNKRWHVSIKRGRKGCLLVPTPASILFANACNNAVEEVIRSEEIRKKYGANGTAKGAELLEWLRSHLRAEAARALRGESPTEAFGAMCLAMVMERESSFDAFCGDASVLSETQRVIAFQREVNSLFSLANDFEVKVVVPKRRRSDSSFPLPPLPSPVDEEVKTKELTDFAEIDEEPGKAANRVFEGIFDDFYVLGNEAKVEYPVLHGRDTDTTAVLTKKDGQWILCKPVQFRKSDEAASLVESDPQAMQLYIESLRLCRWYITGNTNSILRASDVGAFIREAFDEAFVKVKEQRAAADRERRRRELGGDATTPTTQPASVVSIPNDPCPFAQGQSWQWNSVINKQTHQFQFDVATVEKVSNSEYRVVGADRKQKSEWTLRVIPPKNGVHWTFELLIPVEGKDPQRFSLQRRRYTQLIGEITSPGKSGEVTLTRQ